MREGKGGRRRLVLRTSDKVILGVLVALIVLTVALSILQRCGLTLINAALMLHLPLLTVFVLVGWGGYALIRRIRNRIAKVAVGGGAALLMLLVMVLAFSYVSYMAFYVTPQRYATVTSPSGAHKVVVLRAFDADDARTEERKAARLAADPQGDPETLVEDWGLTYIAYPQVTNLFYRANADVEGEVHLAIDESLVAANAGESESPPEESDDARQSGNGDPSRGTLMVDWLENETVAHFYVENPGVAEGGECWVRF